MFEIDVQGVQLQLDTSLRTIQRMETKFRQPMNAIFAKMEDALVVEMLTILTIGSGEQEGSEVLEHLRNTLDYSDMVLLLNEYVARLMFSGTPEQNEAKMERMGTPEDQKNALRKVLGMPIPESSEDGKEY